ncbi:MAG: SusC/RagA family TonB-linked outer membrane protein [Paludibacter sp.]|nr:SusC/RagA family TonB-linked outer membrane protein [Paludibacter sp.]
MISICKTSLVALLFLVVTTVSAKEATITLHYQNVQLKTILSTIEKQTKQVFIYNNESINDTKLFSINCDKLILKTVLNELFIDTDIEFKIVEYYVFLTQKKQTESSLTKEIVVEGVVSDKNFHSIPGVSVSSSSGLLLAVTNNDGYFRIENTLKDSILTFHMLGFIDKKVHVYNKALKVTLETNNILLDELLVVGYGLINTKELTGSVVKLKSDLFSKSIGGDVTLSFQGQASGVYASNDRLRVRGISSINSSSDPFIVIDGVPQSLQLKDLNPDDIESIEVLKDAASAAIYGSRAANGVILVTTKNGKFNTPSKLTVDSRAGIKFAINAPHLLTGIKLLNILDDAYYNKYPERKLLPESNSLKYFPFSPDYSGFRGYSRSWLNTFLANNPSGENWTNEISQPNFFQNYRLSLQGGQSQSKYLASLSYLGNKDFIKGKSTDRITLMLKNEYRLLPWFSWGVTSKSVANFNQNSTYPSFSSEFTRSSLLPVYAPDNSGVLFDSRNSYEKKGSNPLYQMQETWDDNIDLNEVLTTYINIDILKNLNFHTDWSLSFGTRRYRYFQSKDYYREDEAIDPTKSGMIMYVRTLNFSINGNNFLTYKTDFSEIHKLKIMLGNNIQSFNSDYNVARYEGFPTDYFQLTNANTQKVYTQQSAGMDGYRFVSFFTRLQYSIKDKYFAEINARADGTSRFNPLRRWGYFPGIGLSWVISDEPFFKKMPRLDYLKTRVSYGLVGNAEMGNFPAQSSAYNWAEYAGSPGFVFTNIGNPMVSWEKQTQINAGFNASAFENRVTLSIDWYSKRCNELLINYNIGSFQGYFSTDVTLNTGILNNYGIDFNITTKNIQGKFSWITDFNISNFSSKVIQLSTQQDYIEKGVNRVVVGQPLALYYLPLWAGVDPVTGHEMIYEAIGQENSRELTGNVLDAEAMNLATYNQNRVLIKDKTPYPKFYGGITNTFNYKNFELSFLIYFQYGNWLYHSGLRRGSYISTYDIDNKYTVLNEHWSSENPNSNVPLLYNSQMSGRENSRYLVDGSYLRLRNIDLRYSFSKNVCKLINAQSVRLFFQAQNVLTISNFINGDPEVSSGSSGSEANITPGIIGSNFGIMTFNLGFNFEF